MPKTSTMEKARDAGYTSTQQAGAWGRGYEARKRGEKFSANPYRNRKGFGPAAYNAWDAGWRAADRESA